MGDTTGRRAHWLPVLVLAPGVAGLFGAATTWASQTVAHPTTVTTVPATAPSSAAAVNALAEAQQRTHLAALRQAAALRRELAHLQALVRQQQRAAAAGSAGGSSSTGVGSGGGVTSGSSGGSGAVAGGTAPGAAAPAPAPAPAPVQAPAPPPVQAVTGASGVKK